jgi:hypothetical protein
MENEEMLEQTNESENVETQTTEENEEGIELTDTTDAGEVNATSTDNETAEVKKSLRDLLRENPEYQEEYNSMLKTRLDREDKKHQKELSKYRDTENVLRTTLNLKDGDDTNAKLREYYEAEGVKLPEAIKPGLSSGEIESMVMVPPDDCVVSSLDFKVEVSIPALRHEEKLKTAVLINRGKRCGEGCSNLFFFGAQMNV